MVSYRSPIFVLGLLVCAAASVAQGMTESVLNSVEFRSIGPFRGGRSCAVSGVPGSPTVFYHGATGGGVWKSEDSGASWFNVSDGYFKTGSVGAIAVAPSQPDTVYVGMGETELRGNITHGDGVYKSVDAGKSWEHLGLTETQFISRVRVHPKNPDVVWVAALGPVFKAGADRGIYKSTDGGKTWKKTLFVNDRAGAVDLSFAPGNPDVMYAATWEAWRTPYSLNSGGPGSKIFKSLDGGETWKDITSSPGLPGGTLGKIGVAVAPSEPTTVYAMVEAKDGGLYKSVDDGKSWKLVNDSADIRQRPWYYTRVYVDPKDAETVWVLNVAYHKSTNGGERFSRGSARHSDHHDLYIDPENSDVMIMGNDGGASVTVDGGRAWSDQDIPTAQFYHVSTDNSFPYNVLGAQQDNSTVRIPSRTFGSGITSEDWTSTAGGESGYVTAHPTLPHIVYGGSYGGTLTMQDHQSGLSRSIDPWPDNPMGSGADVLTHRFQWTFPIVMSPHNPEKIYTASQYVMVSYDRGGSWTKISPDLTTNNKAMQKSSGGPITQDNTGVEYYCTVFTVAESPRRKGVIWAGSDDGLIHVTRDDGKTWTNVTPPGMPSYGRVSLIEASPHDAGTAYAAVNNYQNGDLKPYVYVTSNYGKSWTLLVNGLPNDSFVRAVREDPVRKGLLYAGLETGIWVSYDNGGRWVQLKANFPNVPVHDLVIKDSDLVVGTHGRSFWILDNLTQVREADQVKSGVHVFSIPDGSPVRFGSQGTGEVGRNPRNGNLVVTVFSDEDSDRGVSVELKDKDGLVVATATANNLQKGLNTLNLFPRYPTFRGFDGLRMWGAGRSPLKAPPGVYQATVKIGSMVKVLDCRWTKDPRSPSSDRELVAKYELSVKVREATSLANDSVVQMRSIKSQLDDRAGERADLKDEVEELKRRLTEIEDALHQGKAMSSQDFLNYPIRLNNRLAALLGEIQSGEFGPTKQSYQVFDALKSLLDDLMKKKDQLLKGEVAKFNSKLQSLGMKGLDLSLRTGSTESGDGDEPAESEGGEQRAS